MNKKIITLIIGVLIIIGIAVVSIVILKDKKESDIDINNSNMNSTVNGNNNGDGNVSDSGKSLILYFSISGNTETVANFIHDEVGGDILKLETVKTYKSDYDDLIDEAQEEQEKNERPELKTKINIAEYDIIFLGYPNWWGDMPMPLYTFLDDYDLSGKTIAPFITHGGSGLSATPTKIKKEEPNATVTEGLAVSGSNAKNSKSTVKDWLSKIGY